MPGGLWVPGAVWEFRQNVRALPTAGVQVVQSSTEPTTWQWEYTIQPEDEPLVDTVGRGDVPPDMLYGCLVNIYFLNNSGATQTYNCRVEVQSQTLGTFWSGVSTRSGLNNNYVYFTPYIHSVGVGTTLCVRLWGTAAHDVASIRLILVPMVTPPASDALLLVETISAVPTPNVWLYFSLIGTTSWTLNTQSAFSWARLDSASLLCSVVLTVLSRTWRGGMIGWFGTSNSGNARSALITNSTSATLHQNGLYGVFDITLCLVDVRFGHLFRNLGGVSKF
jgi:hypothetical protein